MCAVKSYQCGIFLGRTKYCFGFQVRRMLLVKLFYNDVTKGSLTHTNAVVSCALELTNICFPKRKLVVK